MLIVIVEYIHVTAETEHHDESCEMLSVEVEDVTKISDESVRSLKDVAEGNGCLDSVEHESSGQREQCNQS